MFRAIAELVTGGSRSTPLDNPRLSLTDPSTWDEVLGGSRKTDAGVIVNPDAALGLAAVWQATSMISGDVAKLPLDLFRRNDESDREIMRSHPAYKPVRRQANSEVSAHRFWRTAMVHALIWGESFAFIDRAVNGKPLQLLNLLPDRTTPIRRRGRLAYITETQRPDGTPWLRTLDPSDVLHFRGISIDGVRGCRLIDHARNVFGHAIAVRKFGSKFFRNGLRAGGILEIPASMKPKTGDKVEEGFRKGYTGEDNWFRTVILRDGAKFNSLTVPPNEGQMLETSQEDVREICRYFNLSPSRMGLSDSVSYNSKSEDNQNYLDSTLSPWLQEIVDECWMKLLTDAEREAGELYFEHNTASLLRMNTMQRYQVYAIAVRNRLKTPNECRALENDPPLPGGDEFPPSGGGFGSSDGGADKNGKEKPRGPADKTDGEAPADQSADQPVE